MTTRVGFVGLGSQGGPMARAIADAGHPLTLWARRPESLEPYRDTAAKTAGTPAELAASSDLVGVCVTDDDDVEEVLLGSDGVLAGAAPGTVVMVHSTVLPETCRMLATAASRTGVTLVDAPVSGGGAAAAAGNLLVMIGGDEDVVDRVRPVLSSFADPIVRIGPLGTGQTAKLLNNVLFTANLAAAAGLVELGAGLGLEPEQLGQAITRGTANSYALGLVAAGLLDLVLEQGGALLCKDVTHVETIARAAGLDPGLTVGTAETLLMQAGWAG